MGMSNIILTSKMIKLGLAAVISVSLSGCEEGKSPNLFKGSGQGGGLFSKKADGGGLFGKNKASAKQSGGNASIKLVERDVESPEVFQVTEKALWDGRPSLGGVWVAHPDSKQPERVIIRNKTNGKFVIGALFKRERDNPGPKLQLSSDAAAALGVLAGAPTTLDITALRRETVNVGDGGGSPAKSEKVTTETLKPLPTKDIETTVLKSVAKAEAEGKGKSKVKVKADKPKKSGITKTVDIAAADPAPVKPVVKPRMKPAAKPVSATPAPAPAAPKSVSSLNQPYIQLGFFSVEANAKNTIKALETRKIPAKLVKSTAKGKTFWRVLAGPAQTKGERDAYLKEIKKMGFNDAYLTKN
jgi:peptidoglycan lytic transglycosylase